MKYDIFGYDGYTGDIRILAEQAGLIKRRSRPEKYPCPECGRRAVYTWRHFSRKDICMAAECSYCDFNILIMGTPVRNIGTLFKKIKERGF